MEGQPKTSTRPASVIPRPASGIPRLTSRLPLPTTTASKSIKPSPSRDRLRADPGLDESRLRRPSHNALLKKPTSHHLSPPKPQGDPIPALKQEDVQSGEDDTHVPEEATSTAGDDDTASIASAQEARGRRGIRPSLSERTLETLAQLPPSPASVRRQSSFFNGGSPVRSPSCAPSIVSNVSRSPSQASSYAPPGNEQCVRPASKLRLPSKARISTAGSISPVHGFEDSVISSRLKRLSLRQSTASGDGVPSDISSPPKKNIPERPIGNKDSPKPSLIRPPPGKASAKSAKSNMGPPERPLQVKKTRKPQTGQVSTRRSPSTGSRHVSTFSNMLDDLSPEQQAEIEARKASKSSSTLRETIAKAKAARKAMAAGDQKEKPQEQVYQAPPIDAPLDSWAGGDDEDPFGQPSQGSNSLVMRKRVQTARATGQLNIAAFSLKEIPKEVLTMYDYDPENSANWFENVDLVKFYAADNELEQISDETFPDINPEEFDPDSDDRGLQFGGLETLDLHGNILKSLPMGLRRLQNLRTLNLSNNCLDMAHIEIIAEIKSLTDLKLANNQLQGELTVVIGRLSSLEFLDLRGNALTKLPDELAGLSSLRTLDVSENKFTSLPFETLCKLPLKTLNAQKNRLEGTLIHASVTKLDTLQSLNIANNAVMVFSANDALELPDLHTLLIGVNRITHLPRMTSWQSLLTLSAEENKIAELPQGFAELKSLKKADFTGNSLTHLDEKIGLMENLASLRVSNNPLRERRLLRMDTDDIKRDLRSRSEPDPQDTDDEGSVATQFTLAPESPELDRSWDIKSGGILDKSYAGMTDLKVEQLEMIPSLDIRCLYLQHNELSCFPAPAIGMLAQCLVELDLSHNPLKGAEFLSSPLELPKLQSLTLNAGGLTSWEPLLSNLIAPSLTFLDVSHNRLKGPLPHLRHTYPELKTLVASDNQIASLDFEAAQGLQVLELSNNELDSLPPKIGLLAAGRSPQNWGNGSALRRFEVAGNRFRVPRWQVVAKGTDAILEFLRERIPDSDLPEWEQEHKAPEEEF
ncbi:putative leucine-rich repeat protein [Penicillium digitatum]|uniref:Putative leucine-rich repeat protein n=3 Tax=Penicillium digitatum TaxID=36651 RepID=K9G1W8_PEND2|nr:putative leucine-rich repeat protein [Penicillium digitatum Pd1]EKV15985.1 putative leucine-rich repeat protein [Penicillium digitatum PHI26]EKV20497.1 putative leucine-rich repeat protein [Penicillium digitatum Pd1]QQK39903.1 putative leucine-rich repeat protein [Penicillium digitatum]